jgi:hypothetical protein
LNPALNMMSQLFLSSLKNRYIVVHAHLDLAEDGTFADADNVVTVDWVALSGAQPNKLFSSRQLLGFATPSQDRATWTYPTYRLGSLLSAHPTKQGARR